MSRKNDRELSLLPMMAGTVVGLAGTAAALWLARRRDGRAHPQLERSPLERDVRESLRADAALSRRGVLVTEIGNGVIELSGMVESADEMAAAVAAAQRVDGVTTVVNRLAAHEEEARLAETRDRFANGDPSLTETHWTGMGVGMGRRRQSPATDPDRPDDHARMIERELAAKRVARDDLEPEVDGGDWSVPRSRPEELGGRTSRDAYGKQLQ